MRKKEERERGKLRPYSERVNATKRGEPWPKVRELRRWRSSAIQGVGRQRCDAGGKQ